MQAGLSDSRRLGRGKKFGLERAGHVKYEYVSVDLYPAPPISPCTFEEEEEEAVT